VNYSGTSPFATKRIGFIKVLLPVVLVLLTAVPAVGKSIDLATLRWPPYVSPEVKQNGVVAEVVREAFKEVGISSSIEFLPWKRVLNESIEGTYDGIFPAYYSQSRGDSFLFSEPIVTSPLAFYRREGQDITFDSLQDLEQFQIGVVMGYMNTRKVDRAEYLTKEPARNDLINLRKLLHRRIDLTIIDKHTARYLDRTQFTGSNQLTMMEPLINWLRLYAAFPRRSDHSQQLREQFNHGLAQLRRTGEFDEILRQHGFKYNGEFFTRLSTPADTPTRHNRGETRALFESSPTPD